MTVPHTFPVDPRLVAHLAGQLDSLGRQMSDVTRNFALLQAQLTATQRPAPVPVLPAYTQPRPAYAQPTPPQPPRAPWWQRDGVVSRVLAVAGVGVTLVGVVMLLVLAAQAGFFGPVPRVVAGAAFSACLVFVGLRVHARPGGRIGGIALAATGIAGAYLDTVAVTAVYGWLHPILGMAVALGIAAAGVGLAVTWNSQPFAVMVVLGGALLAPFATDGLTVTLIGFLFVVQVATFAAQLRRDWPYLSLARTVPVVIVVLAAIVTTRASDVETAIWVAVAAVSVCAFGLGSSIVMLYKNSRDITATVVVVVTALPAMFAGELFARPTSIVFAGAIAAVMLGTSVATRRLPAHARYTIAGIGALELLVFCMLWSTTVVTPVVVAGLGVLFLVAAGKAESRVCYGIGVAYTIVAGLVHMDQAPLPALADGGIAVAELGVSVVFSGIMLAAGFALTVKQAHRLELVGFANARLLWLASGAGILYVITSAVVAAGTTITHTDAGFVAGHCTATIVWMLAATAALLFGLAHRDHARPALGFGLALTAAAVAKLFLFDLATLNGIARVFAFIAVGLLLLGAGTRYAREFAERGPVTDVSDEQ
ncbi:DUF2339 domain-containing protein [Rhodococcus sp. NPDC058521]|uniref:DUF2339 domain-containing protein n=1 Tax=Rhodococcus sp. NPDC058521 TaxID=3346536 RepID=UPI00364BDF37